MNGLPASGVCWPPKHWAMDVGFSWQHGMISRMSFQCPMHLQEKQCGIVMHSVCVLYVGEVIKHGFSDVISTSHVLIGDFHA